MTQLTAPIIDLRQALQVGSLGELNPVPWVFMTGNCLGWCAYAYYTGDPFVLAANLPGLLLSLWLNQGAIKLQYLELKTRSSSSTLSLPLSPEPIIGNHSIDLDGENENNDFQDDAIIRNYGTSSNVDLDNPISNGDRRTMMSSSSSSEQLIFVSQEVKLYRILLVWCGILLWVGWIAPLLATSNSSNLVTDIASREDAAEIVGWLVNVNLIFFYGAPLTSILQVLQTRRSSSIHRPTMYMSSLNATFWTGYGTSMQCTFVGSQIVNLQMIPCQW